MYHDHAAHDLSRDAHYDARREPSLSSVALFLLTGCEDAPMLADVVVPRDGQGASEMAGTWETTAMTSREPSEMTVRLEQTGRTIRGSVHLGPPAFDVTLSLVGALNSAGRLVAKIGSGDGLVDFVGTLYDDGMLEGPVSYAGRELFTLQLRRR